MGECLHLSPNHYSNITITYELSIDVGNWEDSRASELNHLTPVTAVLELLVHSGKGERGWCNSIAVQLASLLVDLGRVQSDISDGGSELLAFICGESTRGREKEGT